MEMDTADPRPAYQRVADELRKAIADGTYQPGDQLPTLGEITRRHGIAVMTARDALRQLAAEGLIVSRQGKGSYVLRKPDTDEQPIASISELLDLFQQVSRSVDELTDRVTAVEQKLADPATAAQPPQGDQ